MIKQTLARSNSQNNNFNIENHSDKEIDLDEEIKYLLNDLIVEVNTIDNKNTIDIKQKKVD